MKIGVLSDTHDYLPGIKKAIETFKSNEVDMIVHCGDWVSPFAVDFFIKEMGDFDIPIKSLYGNNEGDIKRTLKINDGVIEFTTDQSLVVEADDKKIVVYHGGDKVILEALIKSKLFNTVFCGHTHKSSNEYENEVLVLNPGSTSYCAESKSTDKATVAIYDSTSNSATIVEI